MHNENVNLTYSNVLVYSWHVGCIGGSGPLTYTLDSDTLTIEKKVLPVGTENYLRSGERVYGQRFKYYKDSLINVATGDAFYSPLVIKKQNREAKRNKAIYIVLEGVKHRITKKNYDRSLLANLKIDDYTVNVVEKDTAYRLYGIPRKYATMQLKKK